MPPTIDELFSNDVIQVYPAGTPAAQLQHTYTDVRLGRNQQRIDFDQVQSLLASLRADVEQWYAGETGKQMDTYDLGEMLHAVQQRFWSDSRFQQAFDLLELPSEKKESVPIPWWNEVAGGEVEHDPDSIHVLLGPRHSYETQLIRSGHHLPIKSVSVAGLIASNDGHLVIGLRGGKSYPNTYNINAGALRVTEGLRRGEESIYDVFKQLELAPEFGLRNEDVAGATIHSRIMDFAIDRGPMYNFLVQTRLSWFQLGQRWLENIEKDKAEHQEIYYIGANPQDINQFIRNTYIGICANRVNRKRHEIHLLHPGALALASYSGLPVSELRALYQEGVH